MWLRIDAAATEVAAHIIMSSWESDLPFARICNSSQVVGFVSGT